jgi:hypothetical protein
VDTALKSQLRGGSQRQPGEIVNMGTMSQMLDRD